MPQGAAGARISAAATARGRAHRRPRRARRLRDSIDAIAIREPRRCPGGDRDRAGPELRQRAAQVRAVECAWGNAGPGFAAREVAAQRLRERAGPGRDQRRGPARARQPIDPVEIERGEARGDRRDHADRPGVDPDLAARVAVEHRDRGVAAAEIGDRQAAAPRRARGGDRRPRRRAVERRHAVSRPGAPAARGRRERSQIAGQRGAQLGLDRGELGQGQRRPELVAVARGAEPAAPRICGGERGDRARHRGQPVTHR